jgi:hypothetical protein
MHDNKLRLSADVINKAQEIADTWGLKNSRAAIEAVFRKYADDYLYGRQPMMAMVPMGSAIDSTVGPAHAVEMTSTIHAPTIHAPTIAPDIGCDALNELDNLLGL